MSNGFGNLTCAIQSRFVKVSCVITRPFHKDTAAYYSGGNPKLVIRGPRIAAYAVPNFPGLSDDFVHPIGPTISYSFCSPRRTNCAPSGPFEAVAPTGPNGGHGPIELASAFW
jgi:hypothetical protein